MNIKAALSKNAPGILIGTGLASMWAAVGLTVKASNKARDILDEMRLETLTTDEEGNEYYIEPSFKEKVKATWKCFIAPGAAGIAGTAGIVAGSITGAKRTAAFAAAASLAAETLKDNKEALREVLTEDQHKEVEEKVALKGMTRNERDIPEASLRDAVITAPALQLYYDEYLGRYFNATPNELDSLETWIRYQLKGGSFDNKVTLNEAFDRIYLSHVSAGDVVGWQTNGEEVHFSYDSMIAPNGQAVLVLQYTEPVTLYNYQAAPIW